MTGLKKCQKALGSGWSSEEFFDALLAAYREELARRNEPAGERVVITDLLPRVAFQFQTDRFRSDPVAGLYRNYGRARLAYDLSRLRREGVFARHGWRLNLGTATGASTQDKKKVLYVAEAPEQGQYYLTLWFRGEA